MHSAPGEEGRFELALSTSLLNELKYGSQLGKLAEALLLSAFSDNSIKPSLQQEIAAALPSVRYISLAAFLNGGVVIRSSNLAVQGDVSVRAQAMGHSAARIAAKQHSIFHGQKKPGEPIKFQELQEAWDQQQCTSTVSVPIPASRHFEDAFIPYHDRDKPLPERGTCPVLYVANGTVGVVHFGLSTTDVKLNGRQGKQFVGLAQSLGPHLGYLLAPALEGLQPQIRSVAAANQQLQQSRRRSVSCSLPPVETLTVHDSADSISSARQGPATPLPNRQGHPPTGHHPSQQRAGSLIPPPPQVQQSATRMLSPFQTWSAPATPHAAAQEGLLHDQSEGSPKRPGSDLSPAKTALDMSMLEVARLHAASPGSGRPPLQPEAAMRRSSGDQGSGRKSATAAEVNAAAVAVMRSSKDLELEYQPSIEASPRGSGGSQEFGRGKGKTHRRPPVPMLRASSPLSAYGSESSGNLPRQLSIPGSSFAGYSAMNEPQQVQEESAQPSPASPFAQPGSMQTPFAGGLPLSSSPPSSAWYASPSMQTSGSTISISSLLPPLSAFSQAPGASHRQSRMSPHAAASLAASLPPEMSTSAMAVLSAPMTAMQPNFHAQSMAALTMPTILPMSAPGIPGRSPNQQSRSMLPPAPFVEPQARADMHSSSSSYRLPPQLQSRSLLLQLLPAGSAQSLNQLMSRAASGASADFNPQDSMSIARSCSLNNDITTSVSVSSPKRSLLNMSRAVSEQLHLNSSSKAVQRPFLADLQQKWTAGHQGSGLLRYTPEAEESDAAISPSQ